MFKSVIIPTEDILTISLEGDLDTLASEQFIDDVSSAMEKYSKPLVLDMSKLDFISSSGLRKLLAIKKIASSNNSSVKVVNASPDIQQVFRLTGFDVLLGI